jgi:two-component system, cell cycle response regulator
MRILIADDSPTPRLMLRRALEDLGHECIVASDGEEAWRLFQGSGVDVVVSDWMMPGMDGDELCRRVRADPDAPYAYFILHTSLEDLAHVVKGMQAGADDYLTKPFQPDQLATRLIAADRITALHRRLAGQQAELERLNAMLFADSRHDRLTGLANRRSLDEDLERMVDQANRSERPFSVVLWDVDRFKQFNDSAGHAAGDEVLRALAGALADQCRTSDKAYRYGGEELLVALPEQHAEGARAAAERMRASVEALAIPHLGLTQAAVVTMSGGVATFEPGDDATRLLSRADDALYEAKRAGRNMVVVSPEPSGRSLSSAGHDAIRDDGSASGPSSGGES